jgi:hypothetical protein
MAKGVFYKTTEETIKLDEFSDPKKHHWKITKALLIHHCLLIQDLSLEIHATSRYPTLFCYLFISFCMLIISSCPCVMGVCCEGSFVPLK